MLAISLGLPALKSKSAKDRQTYQVAWLGAETLACVKLPVFGKQISCRFGGTPKWPLTTNDVMKPPTTILLLKKSRNLRGVKKVEARDVASPNFPLEGNYMTATPQGIGELGANLVRIFKQCVGNFC